MRSEWRYLVPAPVRELPVDLVAVLAGVGATLLVVAAPVVRDSPLRVLLGLPFLLFLPGYALLAVLFPEAGPSPGGDSRAADAPAAAADPSPDRHRGIDGVERVALSFGLSIAIVPLLGIAVNITPWGIRLWPVLLAVGAFTVACAVAAGHRRSKLPPEERFRVPLDAWIRSARSSVFGPTDRVDAGLNVVLALSVLLAVGSVGFAVAVPPNGEQFTEFYLLTEDDDGDLVAADYPEELTAGEPAELYVGVGNQEHAAEEYTVIVQLQRVETANNETTVVERTELDRFDVALADNETRHVRHEIAPETTGEDLRLKYLLYRGAPPATPSAETAYRDLHLWVDVVEADPLA